MGDRLVFILSYGAVFIATALWAVRQWWLRGRDEIAPAARGISASAVALLAVGLVLYGLRVGYWPFHTAYELLTVGLLGLTLACVVLLPQRDGLAVLILSGLASLMAVCGLLIGAQAESAALVFDSGWQAAYVTLSAFGGGALMVAGVAIVVVCGRAGQDGVEGRVTAQRALAWGLLALSAGLACGAWWFHRLSGRYWGDARWVGVAVSWLVTMAAWHVRRGWLKRGWRSAWAGVILGLAGGYVVSGLGGVG